MGRNMDKVIAYYGKRFNKNESLHEDDETLLDEEETEDTPVQGKDYLVVPGDMEIAKYLSEDYDDFDKLLEEAFSSNLDEPENNSVRYKPVRV